ncbi:zinc finger CCHC domain-containing protein 12 [Austrofundulus limnaeus]|uniref:Zinc finger CCHC domain-containing protein 12 n=1 Tax=Austrofundulus limnaeus TaxID=52670 RepID=A0A2I4CGE3_AUSLI|nr:PREDICTED: zinc finger CCHC domain-containing protein 12-like [Austrofundulus limnaeus]
MDFVEKLGIKIPNAVIVNGVTGSEKDSEVFEYLRQYGEIVRMLTVEDSSSEFYQNQVIEFTSGLAVQQLTPVLPYLYQSADDPNVRYCVRALTDVYTKTVGGCVTDTYLNELKGLAKLSGKDFEEVLREVMSKFEESMGSAEAAGKPWPDNSTEPTQSAVFPPHHIDTPHSSNQTQSPDQTASKPSQTSHILSPTDLISPEVQKIVVEHVVKTTEKTSTTHSTLRLRAFSGKNPRPYTETDYETWRSHVDLMMEDLSLSNLEKSRKILESLLTPASDVIRPLGPDASPVDYLQLLESAFGTVEDGEELLVRFMNTLQDHGEKPSAYLHRLQVALSLAVRRGGVDSKDTDRQLLKQFQRGCWDDGLLTELQLELKKKNPPTFAELLLFLRTAENRQEVKSTRMRKHFNATKQKAVSHEQTATETKINSSETASNTLNDLKKQIADLKSQLAAVVKQKKQIVPKKTQTTKPDRANPEPNLTSHSRPSSRPKPWYCFRCGEDGHIVANCDSEPNPSLVEAKRKELKVKRQMWDSQHSGSSSLN